MDRLAGLSIVWSKREYRAFFLVMVLSSLGVSASMPLISLYLVNELHVGLSVVGLFYAVQALPGLVVAITVGRMSDRWRSRLPALRVALVWAALGWVFFAFAPSIWLVIAAGVLFLSAGGAIMGQVFAALYDVMTRDDEPHAALINTVVRTGFSLGYVIGPVLGTELAALVTFRTAFLSTAALDLICLLPLYGLDVRVARSVGTSAGVRGAVNFPLIAFTALSTLVYGASSLKYSYMPIDVTTHLGGNVRIYGTVVAVSPIVELVAMPAAGMLSVKIPLGRLLMAGLAVAIVEYVVLAGSTAIWQLYVVQAMDAWVVAVIMGLGLTYAQRLAPAQPGYASGLFGSAYGVGGVIGNLAGSAAVRPLGIPHVFVVSVVLCAVSLAAFCVLNRGARGRIGAARAVTAGKAMG